MSVSAYKSATTRRIYTNQPFKRGMLYQDITINDGTSRTIVNLDISSNGDYAYPRPAFVNAVMDNFFQVIRNFPTTILKQTTSLNKTFLIGFEQTVNEEDYLVDNIPSNGVLTKPFGLDIIQTGLGFSERRRRDGIFKITDIGTIFDGDTFVVVIENENNEEEEHVVRLLGIDTPELHPEPEDYAVAAKEFVEDMLDDMKTPEGYSIIERYMQYEPATSVVDRTDSERTLAYILLKVQYPEEVRTFTLTEMLLRAGLGVAQFGEDFIYYDRFKEAYDEAAEEERGIHPIKKK